LGSEELSRTRKALNWPYEKFDIPDEILDMWRTVGKKSTNVYQDWIRNNSKKVENIKNTNENLLINIEQARKDSIRMFLNKKQNIASRKSSELVIEKMNNNNLNLLGGSADLTGSNNTYVKSMKKITSTDFNGNYIHWGVREHCMAAAMNGIALHGFFIPYGGTFLVFSDYCRPSIRLSALMRKRVIYVFTHDSIGLGEDGPTHQPIEHLSSLRDIPNLNVFRPCDSVETAECWALALANDKGPSVIALSRQNLKLLRDEKFSIDENYSKKGAYVILDCNDPQISIIATGSEVELAYEASKKLLIDQNIKSRVISVPCIELFAKCSSEEKNEIMNRTVNIFIEAGTKQSWSQFMKKEDKFIGLESFGMSGPGKDVFEYFQITVDRVVKEAEKISNIK